VGLSGEHLGFLLDEHRREVGVVADDEHLV